MGWISAVATVASTLASILNRNREVCYEDDGIGCFKSNAPFDNAQGKLPESPADMSVSVSYFLNASSRLNKNK